MANFVHERANALDAGGVVRLAKINRSADLGVHLRAAEFFGCGFLPDGGLDQRRGGEEKPASFGHQNVIAHYRQIRASGNTHAHDRGDLRNAHRAHHGVIAEYAAKVVGIGEYVFLQRQKNAGGIDEIQNGNAVFDRDVLRADHFLGGHRKERARFYGGVVRNDHHQATGHATGADDGSSGRRAAPFLVHFVCGVEPEFEKLRFGINQECDSFAGSEAVLLVLGFDGFCAAAFADAAFFVFDFGEAINHLPAIGLKSRGFRINVRFDDGSVHPAPFRGCEFSDSCQRRATNA